MSRSTALERARLRVQGERGVLELRDGQVTITKEGPAPSRVVVPVDGIRSTSTAPSWSGRRRWLHVNALGGSPTPTSDLVAMTDPYTLRVTRRSAGAAKRFVRLVHEHLQARGLPSEPDPGLAAPEDGRYSTAVAVTDPVATADQPDEPHRPVRPVRLDQPDRPDRPTIANGNGARPSSVASEVRQPRQLAQLSELHAAGALTDEEFTRARARLLR